MSIKTLFIVASVFILSLGIGCFDPGPGPDDDTGTLVLNMTFDDYASSSSGATTYLYKSDGISYTILPPIDMAPASYDIHGVGPGGATFDVSTDQGSITIEDLAFGDWTITVYARNSVDTIIGEGSAPATVNVGQTTTVDVTVGPLDGFGNLSLTVTWNGDDTQTPSIEAELISSTSAVYNLDFPISGGDTGTYDSTTDTTNFPSGVPDGYYTLSVKLYDGVDPDKVLTMGAVEVVRIVNGQTTTGAFDFTEINQETGDIVVNIDVDMEDPLSVTMSGQLATINEGESMTVTASVASSVPPLSGSATYVWYINGESVDTGETVTLGSDLDVGVYRLDVTAFSADGTRAGSATYMFHVEEGVVTGPVYGWTKQMGGVNGDNGYSIVTDTDGNIYLTGTFRDTVNFGQDWGETDSKTSAGEQDIYIAKINSNGTYGWTKRIGGFNTDAGNSITTDNADNVYIVGNFRDTVDFGADWGVSDSKTSLGISDTYVTKINSNGSYGWTRHIGGDLADNGQSLTIDYSGNIYLTGHFVGTVDFGADWGLLDEKTSAGSADIYVTKINSDGSYGWTKRIGGTSSDVGYSIDADPSGNIYITSCFMDTVNFSQDWGETDNKTTAGDSDISVTKINTDGTYAWTKRIGDIEYDRVYSLTTDNASNVYLTGFFRGTIDFGVDWGVTDSKTSVGSNDIFITKVNNDGSYGWTKQMGGADFEFSNSITSDISGNIYITGYFNGTADFGADWGISDNKTTAGDYDIFLTKINSNGSYGWTKRIGNTLYDAGFSITADNGSNVYITGYFRDTVDFGEDFGYTDTKTSIGDADAFVTKIDIQ